MKTPDHSRPGVNTRNPINVSECRPRHNLTQPLKRPPYARRLREVLTAPGTWPTFAGTSTDGRNVSIWVLAGADAWNVAREYARGRYLFLACPPDADPEALDWRLLAGHDPVLLRQCGQLAGDTLKRLVLALLRGGTERVLYLPENGQVRRYIRAGCEVKHVAA